MPSMGELLIVLAIVLVLFGANKLPGIGDALGRTIKNFRRSATGDDELEVSEKGALDKGSTGGELSSGGVEDAEVVATKVAKKIS